MVRKQLKVVVVGTSSSMIAGPSGTSKAYPVRLQEELTRRLTGTDIKVVTYAKPRETAAEAEKALEGHRQQRKARPGHLADRHVRRHAQRRYRQFPHRPGRRN